MFFLLPFRHTQYSLVGCNAESSALGEAFVEYFIMNIGVVIFSEVSEDTFSNIGLWL